LERLVENKIRASFGDETHLRSLAPLAGDASSRRYYRAFLDGPEAPRSVVIMELAGSSLPLSSEELAIFSEPPKELPFLNLHRFLTQLGVCVPALFGHWVEDGILLLEDLGDLCLWDAVQRLSAAETIGWYKKAIDELLLIQVLGTKAKDDSCMAFQQRFDLRLYMWEFEHFIEYGLEKREKKTSAREKELLTRTFTEIARRLDSQPPCLNHRDYHSWNLMVHGGEVTVIDFQDALLAPPQYDLASLLNDRETDRLIPPDTEDHLLAYYLQKREEMGEGGVNPDEFFEIYLLSALQRDFKVVGRFYYLDLVKGKPGYKKYIPPTLRRLKRNLLRTPHLEKLVPVLAAHFEEMR
jgi:aminoglycoside/choline kinase family phosphotransferase